MESDIPRITEMGIKFREQSAYKKHLKENHEKVRELMTGLVANGGVLVSEEGGLVVGMFGFGVFPHFMSGENMGVEIFWWMEPEHRGGGTKLLKAAEDKLRNEGVEKLQMIAPDERVGKLYSRLGYQFVESTFQKAL